MVTLKRWTCLVHGYTIIARPNSTWEPDVDTQCSQWLEYYFSGVEKSCRFTPVETLEVDAMPDPGTPEYDALVAAVKALADEALRRRGFRRPE